jgi:hypothetical protein
LEGIIREEPENKGRIKSGRNERGLFKKDNQERERSRDKTRKFTNLDKE